VSGTDTLNGQSITIGSTFYSDLAKKNKLGGLP